MTNTAEYWPHGAGKHTSGPQNGTRRSHILQNSVAARSWDLFEGMLGSLVTCTSHTTMRPDIIQGRADKGESALNNACQALLIPSQTTTESEARSFRATIYRAARCRVQNPTPLELTQEGSC